MPSLPRHRGPARFPVFALDLGVLLGKLFSFLSKLFVGLLQFLLLSLEFAGELLRLFQQAFGLHGGFDAVKYDADTGRQLLQEGKVGRGESI